MNLTTSFRKKGLAILSPLLNFLARTPFTPNQYSLFSILFALVAAFMFYQKSLASAAAFILLAALSDIADGAIAKKKNKSTKFGAVFDWIADKYTDSILIAGIVLAGYTTPVWGFLAITGTLIHSFMKPTAYYEIKKDKKFEKVGFFGRPETIITITLFTVLGIPGIGVILVALLANLSVLQRVLYLYAIYR